MKDINKYRVWWKCGFCDEIHMAVFSISPFEEHTWKCANGGCEFHNGATIVSINKSTGRTDKNDNLMFGGDIVIDTEDKDPIPLRLEWDDDDLCWLLTNDDWCKPYCKCRVTLEVIGNIHDNPELMESDK